MNALTTVTVLLVCLSSVSASPPTILAYNVGRGETAATRLLDCIMDAFDNFRCRPVRHRSRNLLPASIPEDQPQEGEAAQGDMSVAGDVEPTLEKDQASLEPNFVIKVANQGAIRPKCEPYEIYVPELDRCEDVIAHLKSPKMTDPRVARWYSWKNAIIDAQLRSRGY